MSDKIRPIRPNIENEPVFTNEYDELELLERLESLLEEMEELGVTTLEEVEKRIEALHKKLDRF